MTPYYQDDYTAIYLGDCRDVLPTLGRFDLVLTDPPYGIGADKGRGDTGRNKHIKQRDYGQAKWDGQPAEQGLVDGIISSGTSACVWGGNYYAMKPSSAWLVWDKENGDNLYADCELAWTNYGGAARLKHHRWHGFLRKHNEYRDHPTQKPLDILVWCILLCPNDPQTILDPFAGSGTTLVAAKLLNRQAVGIEVEERYCEIAAKRLSQGVLPLFTQPETSDK